MSDKTIQKLSDNIQSKMLIIEDGDDNNGHDNNPSKPPETSIKSDHLKLNLMMSQTSSINRQPTNLSENHYNLRTFHQNKIRIGPEFQASIESNFNDKDHHYDGENEKSILLWKPQSNIDDNELCEFIDLAKNVANLNEEQSLGFLTALDFQLENCIEVLGQLSFTPKSIDYNERSYIERFIFTEHKLDMIKLLINNNEIVNKLFYLYYTKQNRPPSVSEVLMINHEEDTTIFDLINDHLDCNNRDEYYGCLNLATILENCYQKQLNPCFDVTRLNCFEERREQINELRKQHQQLQQKNLINIDNLRKNSNDYLRFLHFLKKCKNNPKWNIYEVIIFIAIMDYIQPKFESTLFEKFLKTKSIEQCQKFYEKHYLFLKQTLSIKIPSERIEAICMYMKLPKSTISTLLLSSSTSSFPSITAKKSKTATTTTSMLSLKKDKQKLNTKFKTKSTKQ